VTLLQIVRDIVAVPVVAIGVYVLASVSYCLWLLLVALLSLLSSPKPKRLPTSRTKFCILIPAHDEEPVISATLESISTVDYPEELFTAVVIADNCSDRTAEIALSFNLGQVMLRKNPDERGKGYALNWALDALLPQHEWDAYVIIDADTQIDRQFLLEMESSRTRSIPGKFVAQGRYDVLNAGESWRTALLAGALSLVHVLRPVARQYLGLTVGLKGNGMCFDSAVLASAPWRGDSLTEDIDHTLDLLEQEDIRVCFVPDAKVAALMPATAKGAASQRERWENGRSQIFKKRAVSMLMRGLGTFRVTYIDAAFDLLVPPLAELASCLFVWVALILLFGLLGGHSHLLVGLAVYSVLSLFGYIVIGFMVAGAPKMAFEALFFAPVYTIWKLLLRVKRPARSTSQWVRTSRDTTDANADRLDPEPSIKQGGNTG
jgi:1,2-diacylglycerol 3-beta-glucosyltransferase